MGRLLMHDGGFHGFRGRLGLRRRLLSRYDGSGGDLLDLPFEHLDLPGEVIRTPLRGRCFCQSNERHYDKGNQEAD